MIYGDYSNKSRTHVSDLMGVESQQGVTKAEKSISEKMQKAADDIYTFAKGIFDKFESFFVKKNDTKSSESTFTPHYITVSYKDDTFPTEESKGPYQRQVLEGGQLKVVDESTPPPNEKKNTKENDKRMVFSANEGVPIEYEEKNNANVNKPETPPTSKSDSDNEIAEELTIREKPLTPPPKNDKSLASIIEKTPLNFSSKKKNVTEQTPSVPNEKIDDTTTPPINTLSSLVNLVNSLFKQLNINSDKDKDIELQHLSTKKTEVIRHNN